MINGQFNCVGLVTNPVLLQTRFLWKLWYLVCIVFLNAMKICLSHKINKNSTNTTNGLTQTMRIAIGMNFVISAHLNSSCMTSLGKHFTPRHLGAKGPSGYMV